VVGAWFVEELSNRAIQTGLAIFFARTSFLRRMERDSFASRDFRNVPLPIGHPTISLRRNASRY